MIAHRSLQLLTFGLAVIVGVSGCSSTRMGSFPKLNLAWWKKSDAPKTRHDESLAAPSKTMSPVNSLVSNASSTPSQSAPSRKPYEVDRSTDSGPPAPRSFGMESTTVAKNEPAAESGSVGLTSNTNAQATAGMATSTNSAAASNARQNPSERFALSQAKEIDLPSTAEMPVGLTPRRTTASNQNEQVTPQRITNPFVNQSSGLAQTNAMANQQISTTPDYPSTSYNSFTPKQTILPVSGQAPADANATTGNPSGPVGLVNQTATNTQANQLTTTAAPGSQVQLNTAASAIPSSYAPGSVRNSPSLAELLKDDSAPQQSAPSKPTSIGGGGSFNLTR